MNRKILLATLALVAAIQVSAQTKLIHYWHFNNLPAVYSFSTPNIPGIKANFSTIDTNKAVINYSKLPGTSGAYTSTFDNYVPTNAAMDTPFINWNMRQGQPAGYSIRARNPSDSVMLTFSIPTTHYRNIVLKFATESSSATSGQKYQLYDYSVDSGATWRTTALSKTIDTTISATYDTVTVRFNDALDASVKNNPKLIFRIRFSGQNTGTSGNNRFDNITLDGDTLITIVTPPANNVLLHYWHFNNLGPVYSFTTPSIPTIKANYSRIDTNKAAINYSKLPGTSAVYTSTLDNYLPTNAVLDTPFINWNMRMGQPAGYSIRARNPSDSMQLTFNIPTPHFKNIMVKFVTESSSATSGQKVQLYDYSVDSGATWRTTALSRTTDTTISATYDTVTVKFNDASDTMVRNNPRLVFRIRFSGQNTGTSGNNRFDNVTVDGDTIINAIINPGAVNAVAAFPQVKVYPNPVGMQLNLQIAAAGTKAITVFNLAGQRQSSFNMSGDELIIDTKQLTSGIYMLNIQLEDGREKTVRFIKQ